MTLSLLPHAKLSLNIVCASLLCLLHCAECLEFGRASVLFFNTLKGREKSLIFLICKMRIWAYMITQIRSVTL